MKDSSSRAENIFCHPKLNVRIYELFNFSPRAKKWESEKLFCSLAFLTFLSVKNRMKNIHNPVTMKRELELEERFARASEDENIKENRNKFSFHYMAEKRGEFVMPNYCIRRRLVSHFALRGTQHSRWGFLSTLSLGNKSSDELLLRSKFIEFVSSVVIKILGTAQWENKKFMVCAVITFEWKSLFSLGCSTRYGMHNNRTNIYFKFIWVCIWKFISGQTAGVKGRTTWMINNSFYHKCEI